MNLLKLIESVKEQGDVYKNMQQNEEYSKEWKKIADKCNVTAEEAQEQWHLLVVEYMEYLRGNHDFSLAKHLDFLQPHLFVIEEPDVIDEDELLYVLEEGRFCEEPETFNRAKKRRPSELEHELARADSANSRITAHQYEYMAHLKNADTNLRLQSPTEDVQNTKTDAITKALMEPSSATDAGQAISDKPREQNSQKDSPFNNLSSMELIFLGYAKQLQRMPLQLQLQTKRKISDIMDDAELKFMEM